MGFKTLLLAAFIFVFFTNSCTTLSSVTQDFTANKSVKRGHRSAKKTKKFKSSKRSVAKYKSKRKKHHRTIKKSSPVDRKASSRLAARFTDRSALSVHANKLLGIPYKYGGKSKSGFDCSGFTSYVFQAQGIQLYGNTNTQMKLGKRISWKKAKKGDLLFFGKSGKISHVALVHEHSHKSLKVYHSTSSKGVILQDLKHSKYWNERLLFAVDVLSDVQQGTAYTTK